MSPLKLCLFALAWASIIYLVNSAIAGQWKRLEWKPAALYFSTVALIGLFGEIFLDASYRFFVGHPLWYYNILPIHGGYTSSYAVITWGLYGLHLYLLHDSLATRWSITRMRHLVLIFSFEALLLEALLTLSARLVFGKYLYYYLPGDLWHVTSVQNFPFYFICGVVTLRTLQHFRTDPTTHIRLNFFLLYVLVFLT